MREYGKSWLIQEESKMLCDNVILIEIKCENFKLAYFQNIIQLKKKLKSDTISIIVCCMINSYLDLFYCRATGQDPTVVFYQNAKRVIWIKYR